MSIEQQLNDRLKQAMRDRDTKVVDVIRQVKAKVTEREKAKGFKGVVDDALYQEVMAAYIKQMRKATDELRGRGDRVAEYVKKLEFEIAFLTPFLPRMLDRDETRKLVEEKARELGIGEKKKMGRLMGEIMKAHQGQVDPLLVKELIQEVLE